MRHELTRSESCRPRGVLKPLGRRAAPDSLKHDRSVEHATRQRDLQSIINAELMLQAIPAHDRDTWVRAAMALKAAFGEAAFDAWDAWSQTAASYDARAAREVWRSIDPNGPVGFGTLVHLAREHGWRPRGSSSLSSDRSEPRVARAIEAPRTPFRTEQYAAALWLAAEFADEIVGAHPYAMSKGIDWAAGAGRVRASGRVIGSNADCLIIPIRTGATGRVQAVQAINPEGAKQTFGSMAGGCLVVGNTLDTSIPWYVAEGWASAVSVVFHHHLGNAVCATAFGKGRLDEVAEILAQVFAPPEITILVEQDR